MHLNYLQAISPFCKGSLSGDLNSGLSGPSPMYCPVTWSINSSIHKPHNRTDETMQWVSTAQKQNILQFDWWEVVTSKTEFVTAQSYACLHRSKSHSIQRAYFLVSVHRAAVVTSPYVAGSKVNGHRSDDKLGREERRSETGWSKASWTINCLTTKWH